MKKIFGLLALLILVASCGGNKENRPLNEYASAFVKDNKAVVAFGKADLNSILTKTDYKKVPKIGVVIQKELDELKKSLNTETPVYFALEGPFLEDGTPTSTYAFFDVKNEDSLVAKLTVQGFDLEKQGDFHFFQSGDVSFGVRKNLGILISKKDEFDGAKMLESAFDKVKDDLSEGKVDQILNASGDIVMGVSIENLYGTSNTDLSKLSKEKQASLNKMVTDSYVQTTFKFENGAAIVETKNLFSEDLKKRMFFKKDPNAGVLARLGTGNPKLGLATNLDMKKFQSFLDEYSPNTLKDLGESMGGPAQFALATGGDAGLAGLLTGELGVVMVGEPNAMEGLSDFNFFVGIGKNGKTLAESMKNLLSLGMAQVDLDGKGLSAYSNAQYIPQAGKKISIPKGCEVFGKKGITGFIYLEGVDLSSFEFEDAAKVITIIKYVTFEFDENGGKLYIKAKDGKENVLKQAIDVLVEELSGKISGMAI